MRTDLRSVLCILTAVLVVGCASGPQDPNPVPVIGDNREYANVLNEAGVLANDVLHKIALDEHITADDRTRLSKAASLWEGLIAYEPTKYSSYLALGMIQRGLDNPKVAERHLRQCLNLIPASDALEVRATSTEAHYQLSRALFDQARYEEALAEASTAAQSDTNNPNYLVARASAYIQLKRLDEARKDLKNALKLDPQHKRALALNKLTK